MLKIAGFWEVTGYNGSPGEGVDSMRSRTAMLDDAEASRGELATYRGMMRTDFSTDRSRWSGGVDIVEMASLMFNKLLFLL